jgi:leucyl aminopeptidase
MEKNFKCISLLKKTGINVYIFVICQKLKQNIEYITDLLKLDKIPKKLFDDYKLTSDFKKIIYTDNFEVHFFGIGNKCDNKNLYKTYGHIGKSLQQNKKYLVHLCDGDGINNKNNANANINIIKNQIISFILGYYNFNEYKSDKKKDKTEVFFYYPKRRIIKEVQNSIYSAVVQNEIRSLINTPANILTSTTYASYIRKNLPENIKIKILNESTLKKVGCNLILGVNKGSSNKAMMVILEYKNNPLPGKTIALIGKGVMFDSGGYSIKHGDFSDMKNDMTGSAIVFALFKLFSKFNVKGHFVGLLPLVENMVDAKSTRPGDILTAYNGKTVEIIDTDSEGRLIMADALAYSANYKPYMCIDIATLTGQAVAIFDGKSSVIMGNNNKYIQQMIQSGIETNEKIWELPMWEEYVELTKSNIADYKNYTYEAKAGTIMAGAFLSNFVPKNAHWIHLDIAGVDNLTKNTETRHYGASGEILQSLLLFFLKITAKSSFF